ncbi:PAS domain S-box protein [Myxosarcina sp. GI1(2024)]
MYSNEQGFCIIEIIFDRQNKPVDYRFLEVNSAFEKQTGLTEAVGKTMRQLEPNHEEYWFEIYGKVALTGQNVHFEKRAAALNRWYEVYAFPLGEQKSGRVGIFFRDVTLQKQLATTTSDRDLKFKKIVSQFNNYIYRCDANGKLLFVNHNLCQRLGYSKSELESETIGKFMDAENLAKNLLELQRLFETRLPYRIQHELITKDGSLMPIKMSVLPVHDAAGNLESAYAVGREHPEQYKPDWLLEEIELPFLEIAETSRDIIWIEQPNNNNGNSSRFVYVNPAYEEVWQRSKDDLYHQNCSTWNETIHPDDRQRVLTTFATTLYRGHGEIEYRVVRPDGSIRWIEDRGFVIRNDKGEIYRVAGIARDISDRKQRELQLEQSNQRYKFLADYALKLLRHYHSEEQISSLLEQFTSLLNLEYYFYYSLAEDGTHLVLKASKGIDDVTHSQMQIRNFDETLEGSAFRSEGRFELKNVRDSSNPQHDEIRSLGITAYSCYVLMVGDRAVGLLSFGKKSANSFTAEEITLSRLVVDLVEVALEANK